MPRRPPWTQPAAALGGLILFVTAATPSCFAQTSETRRTSQTAAAAYSVGVSLVYRGRRLEEAAKHLAEAVRLAPTNPDYRLALGCAFARRAVVIRRASDSAVYYKSEMTKYPTRYATWERAQSDKTSALYGAAPPTMPVRPTLADDGTKFTLDPAQAKEQAGELGEKAMSAWDTALTACTTDAERANAQYVRGWGMIRLRRIANSFVFAQNPAGSGSFGQSAPWLDPNDVPSQKQVTAAFQAAADLVPENARYWQSLGDSFVIDGDSTAWDRPKAIAAYEKALTLDRRSPTLWYQVFSLRERTDLPSATAALEKAAETDSTNAYYWYLLANLRLKSFAGNDDAENGEKAKKSSGLNAAAAPPSRDLKALALGLDALQKGNTGTFRPVPYAYAIPKILGPLSPNYTWISTALYDLYILILPQNVALAVKDDIGRGDTAAAVAAARTSVIFSDRIQALCEAQSKDPGNFVIWNFSSIATNYSYSSLADALDAAGDAESAAAVRARLRVLDAVGRKRAQSQAEAFKQYGQ
ncbi:MAG: hypothetical protein V4671_02170 [Armatimonadota bacterium]